MDRMKKYYKTTKKTERVITGTLSVDTVRGLGITLGIEDKSGRLRTPRLDLSPGVFPDSAIEHGFDPDRHRFVGGEVEVTLRFEEVVIKAKKVPTKKA